MADDFHFAHEPLQEFCPAHHLEARQLGMDYFLLSNHLHRYKSPLLVVKVIAPRHCRRKESVANPLHCIAVRYGWPFAPSLLVQLNMHHQEFEIQG